MQEGVSRRKHCNCSESIMLFFCESLLQVVKIHFQNYLNNSIAGILRA